MIQVAPSRREKAARVADQVGDEVKDEETKAQPQEEEKEVKVGDLFKLLERDLGKTFAQPQEEDKEVVEEHVEAKTQQEGYEMQEEEKKMSSIDG